MPPAMEFSTTVGAVCSPEIEAYRTAVLLGTGVAIDVLAASDPTLVEVQTTSFCRLVGGRSSRCAGCRQARLDFRCQSKTDADLRFFECFCGATNSALAIPGHGGGAIVLWSACVLHAPPSPAPFEAITSAVHPSMDVEEQEQLGRLIGNLPVIDRKQLHATMLGLAFYVARAIDSTGYAVRFGNAGPAAITARARGFIDVHFAEPIGANAVASRLHIDKSHLGRVFRRQTGRTLTRYLAEVRVRWAMEMLVKRRWRVTDVAFAAGFGSIARFNAVFKRITGCSPTGFRARKIVETVHDLPSASVCVMLFVAASEEWTDCLRAFADAVDLGL